MKLDIDLEEQPGNITPEMQLFFFVQLWKHLLAHDEIINAETLLESAPWQIRARPEVQQMKAITADMLTHVYSPEGTEDFYKNYGAQEALALDREIPDDWSQALRWRFALKAISRIEEANPGKTLRILDVASSDGWLANRLALKTKHVVHGIDTSEGAVTFATQRAEEFKTGAVFRQQTFGHGPMMSEVPRGEPYDIVILFEVYEHVANAQWLIAEAADHLSPGGTLLISTPRGSWCMGHQVSYHEKWNERKPREHVRAPIYEDILADCQMAGLTCVENFEIPIQVPDVPGQCSLFVRATKESK